jgi:hypothetical protein
VGLLDQAQQLSAQALILKNASDGRNTVAIQCAAQSIIDIAEGSQGAAPTPLPSACAPLNITQTGDGFGLLGTNGYISTAAAHASLAATQSDSTNNIRIHAGHVRIAMDDLRQWVGTVDSDAHSLLVDPNNPTRVQEIVTLSDHALNGVDLNNDEHVDPVPGEAGAITAYIHGQLMALLPLKAGAA